MLKQFTASLLVLVFLNAGLAFAQNSKICADGRIQSSQRVARATPSQQRLMEKYDVKYYKIDIALERTSTYVDGKTIILAKTKSAALDSFAFELYQSLQIDSIIINNVARAFTRQNGMTYVKFPTPIAPNSLMKVRIGYE